MIKLNQSHSLVLGLLTTAVLAGCGSSGVPLSAVEGVVLLDGQPLPNAIVEFQPEDRTGKARPSIGETGPDGKYRLRYSKNQRGAVVGKHKVLITTFSPSGDGRFKERVPSAYNTSSTLVREVERSSNWVDFDLLSSAASQQSLASDR
ncbi:MAG TPA: hypothetical protein VGM98_01805 [Schlesneria sp.]|jgi:hypothetical protein